MTDKRELIALCKKHDAKSQRALYDYLKPKLMGVCRRYSGNRYEAQDILQEAFIKIFAKIGQLESAEYLDTWCVRITIHTAINYYHKNKRHTTEEIELNDVESDHYDQMMDSVSDEYLIRFINELPDKSLMVFNLNVVEGYSHEEIGVMLNISDSTSRSQLHYAKYLLKEKLKTVGVMRYERSV